MMNRRIRDKCAGIVVLVLLMPMLMLNASQAMALCVSPDGHVAIELLIEDHCTCEVRTSGADADSVPVFAALSVADDHSQSCTDLSIPIGACDGRTASITKKAGTDGLLTAPPLPPAPTIDVAPAVPFESPPVSVRYHTPLSNIILQV